MDRIDGHRTAMGLASGEPLDGTRVTTLQPRNSGTLGPAAQEDSRLVHDEAGASWTIELE